MSGFRYESLAWHFIDDGEPHDWSPDVDILLIGGPLDGQERSAPAEFFCVTVFKAARDEFLGAREWLYRRTEERTADGRIICRYGR